MGQPERERTKWKRENFPTKNSNLRHSLDCSQNKGLSEYQLRASHLQTGPSPCQRQRGRLVTARAGRQGAILAPEMASSTKLWAGSQLLTRSSWDPGRLMSARRVAARDQLPRGDTGHTWDGALAAHPGNWVAGTGEVIKTPDHLGQCAHQAPGLLSSLDLGRAQNAWPTQSVASWSTWEPEPEQLRPGKCAKPRAHFGQFPCRATWSLSSVDQESTSTVSWGKPSVILTLRALPTHSSDYLFVLFLPPHSTTERVSLNKWPPSPPCVMVEIRHWRDLQIEEAKKSKEEGNALEVTGVTD